ncbi:hypothetical protein BMS3Abin11_00237 [bacterium BMS3Abin11]|nr:hypothetical protein BMS3Abin11_00237 [bacterium BMS3Abin11]
MPSILESFLIRSILAGALLPLAVMTGNAAEKSNPAQPLLEKFDKGYINWKSGEYIANVSAPVPTEYRGKAVSQAMGKELALRVSRALADSVFIQIVADTRVDAKHRLSQLVKGDAEIKLVGNIRGKELIQQKWVNRINKLWLEASYRISMHGVDGVISHIYDQAIEARPVRHPAPAKAPAGTSDNSTSLTQTVVYIDARGTGLQPALFPVIMDQSGAPLLDPAEAGKSYISENRVLEYVVERSGQSLSALLTRDDAIIISAVKYPAFSMTWIISTSYAEEPAPVRKRKKRRVMKATEAEGLLKSNIIVGKEDAKRLRQAQANGELSARPRIIVITDGTVGGTEGKRINPGRLLALLSQEKKRK